MSDADGFTRALSPAGSPARDPLGTREQIVVRIRPSARRLVVPAIVVVVASGGAVHAIIRFAGAWTTVAVLCGYGAVLVLAVLLPLASWSSRRIIVTTRRVIVRSGMFVRQEQELPLARCAEVLLRRSWLQILFRCGDLRMRTVGSQTLVLRDAPVPRELAAALRELAESARLRHGG